MTVPTPRLTVSVRDASEPRALAARLIAAAHRHAQGWTVDLAEGGRVECLTFDAVPDAVTCVTGVGKLLIIWPGRDAA